MKNNGVKLLAAVMVFAMAFTGVVILSDDTSAATPEDVNSLTDLNEKISSSSGEISLKITKDITGNVVVGEGKIVTIDLNGFKIVNESSTDTISVSGTLVIIDSSSDKKGIVDNTYNGKAAVSVAPSGNVTLNGGTYTRSMETGKVNVNQNSYYVLINHGIMTINEGVTVSQSGNYSSMIENGWSNGNNNTGGTISKLTINGGTFTGGLNTVKNDDYGQLTIKNGTFTNTVQATVLNWNVAQIDGGSFTSSGVVILNAKLDNIMDKGELTINGGTFTPGNGKGVVTLMNANNGTPVYDLGTVTVAPGIKNVSIVIPDGQKFGGTVAFGNNKVTITDITAGNGGLQIQAGSVEITGTMTAAEATARITNAQGTVVLKNLTLIPAASNNTLTIGGTIITEGTVTVSKGVTIDIIADAKLTVSNDSTLNVSGTVKKTGTGVLENNGTVALTDVGATIPPSISGNGNVDTSIVASEGTLSGTYHTTTTFTKNQTITATGDITLVKGTVFTFEGMFIVPEGVTVTVEDGAKLVIATSTGKLVNDGTIIIESKASAVWNGSNHVSGYEGAFVLSDGEVINNGVFELDYSEPEDTTPSGWVMNIASGTFTNKGTINVGDESEFVVNGNFVNEGTLNLDGEIVVNNNGGVTSAPTNAVITNSGDMILSGETRCAFTIYITSLDATVTFDGMASMSDSVTITVSNEKYTETGRTILSDHSEVEVRFGNLDTISGLKITMDVVKNDAESTSTETKYDKVLVIDGAVSASTTEEVENPVIAMFITTTGKNMIPGEVSLTEKVTMTIGGTMTVDGKLTYTVKDSKGGIALADSSAVLNVNGTVSGNDKQITVNGGKINAVYYKIDGVSSTPDMHYYTTIYNAVASEAKTITVMGTVTITEDVTIPATMTLDNLAGLVIIDDDAKVTMTTGSKLKNGNTIAVSGDGVVSGNGILVKGTLYVEDVKGTLKTLGKIISEVIKNGEKDRTYTSLALALSGAADGETIVLSDDAIISKNATIRAGVTVDTNNKDLTVGNDATLTVEGTLYINGTTGKLILAPEDATGNITKKAGAVVLKGTIKSVLEVPENLKIAGAYYSITDSGKKTYYVETVDVAAPKITTFDGTANNNAVVEIKTFDDKFTLGDVSFTGNTAKTAVVVIKGQVTAKTITLDVATLQINDGVKFVGQVTNSTGTVALDGTAGADFEVKSITKDDAKTFTVAGNFTAATKKNVTLSGDVTVGPFTSNVTVIDGNVTVADNSNLGKLTVNGNVVVVADKTLTATTVNVFGSIDAADATEAEPAGRVVAIDVYLGLSESNVRKTTGATATIDGIFQISGLLYVLDGCTVSEDLVKDVKSLDVYVEDKLWMTVYAMGTTPAVDIDNIPVENVDLAGWTDKNGKDVPMPVTINDNKVYAKIEYNVYTVNVQVAEGIDDVYMDGVLMKYTGSGFTAKVSAGQHTISYTLSNGYGGEAVMLVNGEKITGYGFTASGSFDTDETDPTDDVEYNIILQGIEKTGYTPDAPDNNGGSDGMSITDYLLIVLVVLIVIMAILVAIRMMRS